MTDTDRKPSMLEIHSQALEKVDESYHEFLLIYKKQAKCVYGFVEGKDDTTFYQCLIEKQLPQGWTVKLIPSGNKQKVLRYFKSLLSRFSAKPKKRIVYGLGNAIIIFAPRARAPESLRDFVEQNYLSFISDRKSSIVGNGED